MSDFKITWGEDTMCTGDFVARLGIEFHNVKVVPELQLLLNNPDAIKKQVERNMLLELKYAMEGKLKELEEVLND